MYNDEETKKAFNDLEDAEANALIQMTFDRDRNLKIKAAQCVKIAESYGGIEAVAVGVLHVEVTDLINNKLFFKLDEPVYSDEFRGERSTKDCWIATENVSATVQASNSFYLQYLAVVDRSTKQVLALHNAV